MSRGDPWGFSTICSPGMGRSFTSTAHSPALPGPLEGLGLQGQGGAEMEATLWRTDLEP